MQRLPNWRALVNFWRVLSSLAAASSAPPALAIAVLPRGGVRAGTGPDPPPLLEADSVVEWVVGGIPLATGWAEAVPVTVTPTPAAVLEWMRGLAWPPSATSG